MTGFRSCRVGLVILSLILSVAEARGQGTAGAAATPVFDVASVKVNKSDSDSMSFETHEGIFNSTNASLLQLISNAYGIRDGLISGLPGWAEKARFDVNAKVVDPDIAALKKLSREQRDAMLAQLLAERFHLKVHMETKQLAVYDLVIAKGGSKLKAYVAPVKTEADDGKPPVLKNGMGPGSMMMNDGELTAYGVPLATLTGSLAGELNRTVIDKTGLSGTYDLSLKWTPSAESGGSGGGQSAADAGPSLFAALEEQLGLKLEAAKGPVVTLVVDHVEMPGEN